MDLQQNDIVELLVFKNTTWGIWALQPNGRPVKVHPRNVDLGSRGRPEIGERIFGAVISVPEKGKGIYNAKKVYLESIGFVQDSNSVNTNKGFIHLQGFPLPLIFKNEENRHEFREGQEIEVVSTNYWNGGLIITMPNGKSNWVDPENFDRGPGNTLPDFSKIEKLRVVVLANRNDNRPYVGARKDQLEKYGFQPNDFTFPLKQ